ncbi:MAG: glycosyltransferase family 2 protein, partial [Planctomycetota bacterium]
MKISVVIPAYNIEDYIERAIDSVLAQTRQPEEIIVVDDGSTDATAQKIKAYGDQVRYIHQANKGLSGARNTGIRQAQNEWVAFLDGDDEWLPEKLQLQSELLTRNPE